MSKAVAKQSEETKSVAAPAPQQGQQILKSDIVVPYLLLMQGMSKLVMEEKASLGEMVKWPGANKLGSPKQTLEFIPLTLADQWIIGEVVAGASMPKFVKTIQRGGNVIMENGVAVDLDATREEIDKTGERLDFKFKYLGKDYVRTKTKNVFCLLPAEINAYQAELDRAKKAGEMPDLNAAVTPIAISFKSKSFKAGKAVMAHFLKAQSMAAYGAKAHGFTLTLGCHQEKNDKGIFYVYDVTQGRRCTPEEFKAADDLYKSINGKSLKIDETALDAEGSGEDAY